MKRFFGCLLFFLFLSFSPIFATCWPDTGFGIGLPEGVTSSEIIKLVSPEIDTTLVTLIGMEKWPYRENTYIAIVCVSRSKKDFSTDSLFADGEPCCNSGYGGVNESENPKIVYLSVIEYIDKLKLVASYPGPLDIKTSWRYSNIDSPDGDNEAFLNPGSYNRFDFEKYKVTDDQLAFGIRVGWQVMYAGGGGYYGALLLFMIQGDTIVNILSEPIDEEGMSSGEWYEDGTRGKNFWERNNEVTMLPQKTSDFYDILIKDLDGDWSQLFKWDTGESRYIAEETNNGVQ